MFIGVSFVSVIIVPKIIRNHAEEDTQNRKEGVWKTHTFQTQQGLSILMSPEDRGSVFT